MQSLIFIQTNHGVSYPLVGPKRLEQSQLADDDETGGAEGGADPAAEASPRTQMAEPKA